MSTGNARYAQLPSLRAEKIAFGLLTRDETVNMAVCVIKQKELNVQLHASSAGTLYDRLMGPLNESERCATCEQTLRNCHGHFGLIQFALPMPDPLFGKQYTDLLGAFCNAMTDDDREGHEGERCLCLKPLVVSNVIERYANLPAARRWRRCVASPQKLCALYGDKHKQRQWVYYTDNDPRAGPHPFRLILREKDQPDVLMNPARVQKWFAERVRGQDLADLGLGHLVNPNSRLQTPTSAEQFVKDMLLVLPNTMRLPTSGEGTQGTIHNDLTHMYARIIGLNLELEADVLKAGLLGVPRWDPRFDDFFTKASTKYVTFCAEVLRFYRNKDNACREMHAQKAYKGVTENIDGKEGVFRQEIFAGRTNNTARTVIASDPTINVDDVGVPEEICDKLVTSEVVTRYNIDAIKRLAQQGKVHNIKGGPQRERRGDTCVDTSNVLVVPEQIQRLRDAIARHEREHAAAEAAEAGEAAENVVGATELARELGIDRDQLEKLLELDAQLREEDATRATKVSACIDSIAPGDTIERTLMDGDIVNISRQPILRKYSIMAHRVVRVKGKAMLLADGSNQPYNADNDGDEMNLHVPQGAYEQSESLKLMYFGRNILSEQSNRPNVGLIQDALLGAMLLTSTVVVKTQIIERVSVGGVEITRPRVVQRTLDVEEQMKDSTWHACIEAAGRESVVPSLEARCRRLGINPRSGRALFSCLFREDFVYSGRSTDKTTPLEIRAGILVNGTLSQATLNTAQNSIHHELCLRYGSTETVRFLSDARRLTHRWLESYGYTLGYKDISLSTAARADIERAKEGLVDEVTRTAQAGRNARGALARHVEADVLRGANNIMDQLSGIVMRHLNTNNNSFLAMVTAGSKGSATSITQMLGVVGQITIQQERPALALSDRRRVDLHYPEGDLNPAARGMCTTSYERGLTPSGMFFQGMATHQAAFDIAVHTGDTGYMQRKLVMFEIALRSHANGSVTNADGQIIQYRYGGDGLNPGRVINLGGKARFINVDSVVDAVKLEVLLSRVKGVQLPPATQHFLTSFEEANVVAKRALALQMGAEPLVQLPAGAPISAVLTAAAEFDAGLIPGVTVFRRLACGDNREVRLERLVAVESAVDNGLSFGGGQVGSG
jgi:DNA-directed RNA polymerase beta' subunit/DNA-directed RNA polymerase subunit K/omega